MPDTDESLPSNSVVEQGQQAMEAERYEEALAAFTEALALDPDNWLALANRAAMHVRLGNFDSALADCAQALAGAGDDLETTVNILLNRARVYSKLERYREAIADLERAARLAPYSPYAHYGLAVHHARLRQGEAAAEALQRALACEPQVQIRAHADSEFDPVRGHPAMVAVLSDPALLVPDPQSAMEYVARGMRYWQMGQYDQAMADYRQAIALEPDNAPAFFLKGDLEVELQQYEPALADYDRAIDLDPHNAAAYYGRAIALTELGQPEQALGNYTQAIAIRPDYFEAHHNRGLVHRATDRLPEAQADFTQAISLRPDDPRAYFQRGMLYSAEGRFAEGISDLSRVTELDPDGALAYLYRGLAYGVQEQFEQAHPDYLRAVELDPHNAEALYLLAASYGRMGNAEESARLLAAAIRIDPEYRKFARQSEDFTNLAHHPAMSSVLELPGRFNWIPRRRSKGN